MRFKAAAVALLLFNGSTAKAEKSETGVTQQLAQQRQRTQGFPSVRRRASFAAKTKNGGSRVLVRHVHYTPGRHQYNRWSAALATAQLRILTPLVTNAPSHSAWTSIVPWSIGPPETNSTRGFKRVSFLQTAASCCRLLQDGCSSLQWASFPSAPEVFFPGTHCSSYSVWHCIVLCFVLSSDLNYFDHPLQ